MEKTKEKKLLGILIVTMVVAVLVLCAVLVVGVRHAGRGNTRRLFVSFSPREEYGAHSPFRSPILFVRG